MEKRCEEKVKLFTATNHLKHYLLYHVSWEILKPLSKATQHWERSMQPLLNIAPLGQNVMAPSEQTLLE